MKNKDFLMPVLAAALLAFTSCEQEPVRVDVSLEAEYSGMLTAIRGTDKSLSEKLALIESAQNSGMTSFQESLRLMAEALASLKGSLEEKLNAIIEAMGAQTTALQTKLALLEEALKGGFASDTQAQELLGKALESLSGTVEEKLAAVETAVKSEASLETKMALIESAVSAGFTEDYGRQGLISTALGTLGGSLEEKLAAIETAMGSRTTGLESKLGVISAALEKGLGDGDTAINNLKKALDESTADLDFDFKEIENQIINQLQLVLWRLGPTEFAKSFQSILNSLQTYSQDTETLLTKLKEAVQKLAEEV